MVTEGIKGNLVSVEWLVKNLNNKEVLILDAAQPQQYTAQHIPGAVSVDFMTYGIKELSPAELEQKFQALGISADKKIVIYDRGAPMMATRVFFDLLYSGFPVKNLFVLNGGLTKWLELNNPVTSEVVPVSKKGNFKINKFNEMIRAKLPEFLTASGEKENNILVEALDANWHFGELHVFDRPGHIPNGILIPATDFFNADKTFKSPEEIKKIFSYHGISKEKQIYTYCGGGIAATVPFFSLKFILDYPDVKLFRESEMGWLQDERELPFWTYDAPYLMRATDWIKTWGGKMMRMYGISKVSLIDVRSTESFAQGHIPFMLNIPSELFKKNIGDPQKLTELLIKSGVNPSHEAVVVSGEGLNEQSALSFLLLEYLGWKKVSVSIDSNEKFVQSGIALEKEEKADNKNGKENQLQSFQAEPINVRKEIIITDPNSTTGVYPKVFISSGKEISNKNPEGKVVHLPYNNFLNADGTPKAAKDIWNILTKAGVPRYAELVCFSDDPGEAAVNYFILKLMGYPDIKVLVI
jgi:3-mercaptopyruvate sulfurtransferase SseA